MQQTFANMNTSEAAAEQNQGRNITKQNSGNEVNPFSLSSNTPDQFNDHHRMDGALAGFGIASNAINQQFSEDFAYGNDTANQN